MAIRYEWQEVDQINAEIYETYRKAATGFKIGTVGADINVVLDSIKLKLSRDVGEHISTLHIRVFTGAWPGQTGVQLSYGTMSGLTPVEDYDNPEWYTISMSPVILTAGVQYCIELSGSLYGSGRNVYWATNWQTSTYSGGYFTRLKYSDDTWYSSATYKDACFEVWGTQAIPTQVGTVKVKASGGTKVLRLISTSDAVTYNNDQTVRIWDNGIVRCADMVATSDTDASPVRIYTGKGLKSWRME